jgi:hypothetical protein
MDVREFMKNDGDWAKIPLKGMKLMQDKDGLIEFIISKNGGAILHVGFAGHFRSIKNRIEKGQWFQKNLEDTFPFVVGIDIAKEAVDLCNELVGLDKYYCYDAVKDADSVKGLFANAGYRMEDVWVLLPDVLEHIADPISFLKGIKSAYPGAKLLISVPNVYSYNKMKRVIFKNMEPNNNDHKTVFSIWSLNKTLVLADITPIENFYLGLTGVPKFFRKEQLAGSLGVFAQM